MIPVAHHLPPLSLSKLLGGGKTTNSETSVLMEIHKSVTPKCLKKGLKIQFRTLLKNNLLPLLNWGKFCLLTEEPTPGEDTDDGYWAIKVHETFFLNRLAGLCGHGYALRGFWGVAPHSHVWHSVHRHLGFVPLLLWAAHKTTAHYLTATDWCMIGC